jgi:hypothetical protein
VFGEVRLPEDAKEMETFLEKGRDFLHLLVLTVNSKHPTTRVSIVHLDRHVNNVVIVDIQCGKRA